MKREYLFLLGFVLLLGISIGTTMIYETSKSTNEPVSTNTATNSEEVVIPQLLTDERENAATMVLIGTPPLQPADHIDRWIPELHHESCMTCHAMPETTGAREVPDDHFYENDRTQPVFRDNCVQCHGEQRDTKTAFNEEE